MRRGGEGIDNKEQGAEPGSGGGERLQGGVADHLLEAVPISAEISSLVTKTSSRSIFGTVERTTSYT